MKFSLSRKISAQTAKIVIAACAAGAVALFVLNQLTYGLSFILFFLRFILYTVALFIGLCRMPESSRFFKAARVVRLLIVYGALLFVISFGVLLALMIGDGTPEDTHGVEYVIIAGAGS